MQEMWLLGGEDPLEKEIATHFSILAWEILWMKSLVGFSPWGHKRIRLDSAIKQQQWHQDMFLFLMQINGGPLAIKESPNLSFGRSLIEKRQPTSVFLPGKPRGQKDLDGLQSMGLQRVRQDWATNTFTFIGKIEAMAPVPVSSSPWGALVAGQAGWPWGWLGEAFVSGVPGIEKSQGAHLFSRTKPINLLTHLDCTSGSCLSPGRAGDEKCSRTEYWSFGGCWVSTEVLRKY